MAADRSLSDQVLTSVDRALRALLAPAQASRPTPGHPTPVADPAQRRQTARLMRVNHAGEIAAQGLYHGQALVARNPATRSLLEQAAREEADHLAWCEQRLRELDDRPSLLDPLWYAGSFAIGALAGLAGDRHSLGFVAETERQVERHLDRHMEQIPLEDSRTRAIVEQMRADENAHGQLATKAGGTQLPGPVQQLMQATARVMTGTARWI
ncbi:MAG: 2-polyprenyl-3-methyl-6-methoxy-1,4-benzoquinone monooxygenase [Pseudoxanthomonas sp.]